MLINKQWVVRPVPSREILDAFAPIPQPVARALFHRGLTDAEAARVFFQPGDGLRTDPFQLKDMDAAVSRLLRAVAAGERIIVYGDYDTDGVTATTILVDFLSSMGGSVAPYIPSRFEEGYGLNNAALENLAGQGARVIVSVDCGARSVEEAEYARKLNVDLIITDHHAPGLENPPAFAFVDPKREDDTSPEKNLAGVGVAFRLIQAIAKTAPGVAPNAPEEYLDLVAIGTVADMVPLLGENRSLVQAGIERINRAGPDKLRPGVDQLLQAAGIRRGAVNSTTIGFMVGPRLNAAGRIDTANTSLHLLLTKDTPEAMELAALLETRNRERQALTRKTFLTARQIAWERIRMADGVLPYFLMIEQAEFNAGVIGLAASKLVEEFYRPCAVVTLEGEFARGSIRSIPGFHVTQALDNCRTLLERYGGHAAAAGFTIRAERLPELARCMEKQSREALDGSLLQPSLYIDSEVRMCDLNWDLLGWLQRLEPIGQGNPAPVLSVNNVRVESKRTVGKDGAHLKMRLADSNQSLDAIGFGLGSKAASLPSVIHVAFTLEENEYYGRQLQMRIIDIQEPQ